VLAHVREYPRARIFIGDFNATPLWPPYRAIAGVMSDAPRALGTAQRTWAPLWWMPRLLRIDHVFAQGMVPIKSRTRRIRRSDHSALIVDFETT
jgi:endonuclease/exonuclease/phosphatase (EEP) superfamily protein YafD